MIFLMYNIGDSLIDLMKQYKHTLLFYKAKRLYDYWYELMRAEQVEHFEWFINKVMYETVDTAYDNMKVVFGERPLL